MNIPQIKNIDTALRIYYENAEIGIKEIQELFTKSSKSTAAKLKKIAHGQMIKDEIHAHSIYKINTVCAYKSWGLDIHDLEKRRDKLKNLGL